MIKIKLFVKRNCEQCQSITGDPLTSQLNCVSEVYADSNYEEFEKYQVRSVPTAIVFNNDIEIKRMSAGLTPEFVADASLEK